MTNARLFFIFEADDLARQGACQPWLCRSAQLKNKSVSLCNAGCLLYAGGFARARVGFPLNGWQENHAGITKHKESCFMGGFQSYPSL